MKPPIEFRQPRLTDEERNAIAEGRSWLHLPPEVVIGLNALKHKRALKAAQMRRYRAKKAGK